MAVGGYFFLASDWLLGDFLLASDWLLGDFFLASDWLLGDFFCLLIGCWGNFWLNIKRAIMAQYFIGQMGGHFLGLIFVKPGGLFSKGPKGCDFILVRIIKIAVNFSIAQSINLFFP